MQVRVKLAASSGGTLNATSGIVLLETALPSWIGLSRQFQLLIGVTKLFFDLCWISRLRDVLERRFNFDAWKLLVELDDARCHDYSSGPTTVVVAEDNGGSSECREVPPCVDCGGTLSNLGPSAREGLDRAPGDGGGLLPTLLPLRETGLSTSAMIIS
jgi:hypothetical protein